MSEVSTRAPSREDEPDDPNQPARPPAESAAPPKRPARTRSDEAIEADGDRNPRRRPRRLLPVLVTLCLAGIAGVAVWILWQSYMASPWTRDGTVRVYVVTMAPEVAGRVFELPVRDNQFVQKLAVPPAGLSTTITAR